MSNWTYARRKASDPNFLEKCKLQMRKIRAEGRIYYINLKERLREKNWQNKLKIIDLFGGKCVRCGESNPLVLQLNHINGGGKKEHIINPGAVLYKAILNGKRGMNGLDLRCANCNFIYEYKRGIRYCPPEYLLENNCQ